MAIRKVTTKTGFECTVDEDTLDDFELLEALVAMDSTEDGMKMIAGFEDTMILLLGEDQKVQLFKHIKSEHGRVRISALKDELLAIFTGLSDAKKN